MKKIILTICAFLLLTGSIYASVLPTSWTRNNTTQKIYLPYIGDNVGIGTTSPYAKLSVVGQTVSEYFTATSTTLASVFPLFTSTTGTTTNFAVTSITSSLLKTNSLGQLVSATPGTDYSNFSYPFSLAGNATSTLTQFNGGLTSYASTTIGNGTQIGGLTISGGATTTGNAYFAGNVGIGTTSPYAKLSVTNTGTDPSFIVEDSTSPDSTPFIIDASGNVGVGTGNPTSKLYVSGDAYVTGTVTGAATFGVGPPNYYSKMTSDTIATLGSFKFCVADCSTLETFASRNGVGSYTLSGNIGIGTTSPYAKLSVVGEVVGEKFTATSTTATSTFAGGATFATGGGNVGIGTASPLFALDVYADSAKIGGVTNNGKLRLGKNDSYYGYMDYSSSGNTTLTFGSTYNNDLSKMVFKMKESVDALTILGSGNVGIGTTSPYAKLSVTNTGTAPSFIVEDSTSPDTTPFIIDASGNVGIGTTGPRTTLDVTGRAIIGANMFEYGTLNAERYVSVPYATLTIGDQATPANAVGIYMRANGSDPAGISTAGAPLAFYMGGPATTEVMRILGTGNVGIGTTSPSQKLSVAGNVLADAYLEYSPIYVGDALSAIKNIKEESNTREGDWAHVDHASLPEGVKYEEDIVRQIQVGTTTKILPSEEKIDKKTGTVEIIPEKIIEVPVLATTTEHFVGRNLGNTIQLALAGVKQLITRTDFIFTELSQLFTRMITAETRINELEARIVDLEKRLQ